ncbi:diadenylate cyclase [Halorussus limi]|uniref:Diadenylate cyclase n=1 Tax=Halorussus limi TaxID=2938695 RepID=A0A8U0HQW1_9EURY|nr:diadenylate cyclase [Halorussus limi]UPV73133.1 diadenylate cyclase [Halorussus limi]
MDYGDLRIDYESHSNVRELLDCLVFALEGISLEFEKWDTRHVKGPGLYVAVVTGPTVAEFADPMGNNQWPVGRCRTVCDGLDDFYETARDVARTRDGAVVVSVDDVIQRQMVRFRDLKSDHSGPRNAEIADYEDWMGARHMSALDTSARPNVVSTLTLSEETGRVTVFQRGTFETYTRAELGGDWNARTGQ